MAYDGSVPQEDVWLWRASGMKQEHSLRSPGGLPRLPDGLGECTFP